MTKLVSFAYESLQGWVGAPLIISTREHSQAVWQVGRVRFTVDIKAEQDPTGDGYDLIYDGKLNIVAPNKTLTRKLTGSEIDALEDLIAEKARKQAADEDTKVIDYLKLHMERSQ